MKFLRKVGGAFWDGPCERWRVWKRFTHLNAIFHTLMEANEIAPVPVVLAKQQEIRVWDERTRNWWWSRFDSMGYRAWLDDVACSQLMPTLNLISVSTLLFHLQLVGVSSPSKCLLMCCVFTCIFFSKIEKSYLRTVHLLLFQSVLSRAIGETAVLPSGHTGHHRASLFFYSVYAIRL